MQGLLPYVINGISAGGQYALIAIGYTLVYGILAADQLCPRRCLHGRRTDYGLCVRLAADGIWRFRWCWC